MNYYEILNVDKHASAAALRTAYRQLVKQWHPDINSTPEAAERIQKINEAYEVLTDHYARNLYDAQLEGRFIAKPPEVSPQEKYRREFLRKRAQQEREKIEFLVKLKVRFYKYERYACYLFLCLGVLFTIDYLVDGASELYLARSIVPAYHVTQVEFESGTELLAEVGLLHEYRESNDLHVMVTFSAVFHLPRNISMADSQNQYRTLRNLYSYHNVFTVIIMLFSLVVVTHKEYTDFRLTCGIAPFLLLIFLGLFVLTSQTI